MIVFMTIIYLHSVIYFVLLIHDVITSANICLLSSHLSNIILTNGFFYKLWLVTLFRWLMHWRYNDVKTPLVFPYINVSCQKGPTRHAYVWQIAPFWQDTLELWVSSYLILPAICTGPVFCLLFGVSSDCARPITGQVTSVTWPVIGWA